MDPLRSVRDALWRLGLKAAYRVARLVWFLTRPENSCALVGVWVGNELLVVRKSYQTEESVPGGGIGRKESPLAAAVRELAEETGVVVAPERLRLAIQFSASYRSRLDHVYFFEVTLDHEPTIRVDRREIVHAEFLREAELESRTLSPHVVRYLEVRRAKK